MAQQYTKKMIRSVFIELLNERPLNKITVKDIALACGINRNTFYYYYSDMYELLSESFVLATRFALGNKKVIYHVYNSMQREELFNYIYNVSGNMMERYVKKLSHGINASEYDMKLIATFYQCALTEMVIQWISSGMKEEPDAIIRRIGELFDGNIKLSLQRSEKLNKI